jgi:hypothetical protein
MPATEQLSGQPPPRIPERFETWVADSAIPAASRVAETAIDLSIEEW